MIDKYDAFTIFYIVYDAQDRRDSFLLSDFTTVISNILEDFEYLNIKIMSLIT